MQITTLGPLAVDGQPIRGERLGAVIRALAEAKGRPVSTQALVETVWHGAPPDNAAGAVQALVSRARRLGLQIEGLSSGYRLDLADLIVDAVAARALVERAKADGDASRADEARALFAAAPDLSDPDHLRLFAEIATVRAHAALAGAGPFDDSDLRRLAAHQPPHEPSVALLVRLLAAQGREAEALDVIEQLRATLAERYGTDPSSVVATAQLALLRGELSAAPPAGQPRQPPRSDLPGAWRRPATTLVGRAEDAAAIMAQLGETPLVTIVAAGGAGKTSLAAEVARRTVRAGRPVRAVEFAGLRSADEVRPAVVAAIVGPEATALRTAGSRDRLHQAARELDGLLVLDNCEHVLAAAAAVAAEVLAAGSSDLTVLATSRAPLGLIGEVVHRLPALPDADALGLLESRARAGGATGGWPTDRALELCHRLDNLPLALELAAARLRSMPIDDVLAGLSDRFALLDDALRGLPDRHASLWATVDWSHGLLAEAEAELLHRLAVIPGPFGADAAASVAGRDDVRPGLAVLVEQSLLTLDQGAGGPPHYRMLETVREYGEVRLEASGGRDAAMAGLVRWARRQASALRRDFIGPGQVVAMARCASDQDSLVAALRWAIGHADEAATMDIAPALFHLWTVRGRHLEVITWAELVLGLGGLPQPPPDAEQLAWTCLLIIVNSGVTGLGPTRLHALARRRLRLLLAERPAEVSSRAAGLATALRGIESADPDRILAVANELVSHPDAFVPGFGLFARSIATEGTGATEESEAAAQEAYHRFGEAGDHWLMGLAAQGVAQRLTARGHAGAEDWLRRSERHLILVGATEDAESVRVLLDVQLALTGDADATGRLTELAGRPSGPAAVDEAVVQNAGQAQLGLAQLAWQEGRLDEVVDHVAALTRLAGHPGLLIGQIRVMFRAAAATLMLFVGTAGPSGDAGSGGDAGPGAAAQLRLAREEALSLRDIPTLGSWTLAGAELAAYHHDQERAGELWALAARLGASIVYQYQGGYGERLTAALGDPRRRESFMARWRGRPVTAATGRIRQLMDDLLG